MSGEFKIDQIAGLQGHAVMACAEAACGNVHQTAGKCRGRRLQVAQPDLAGSPTARFSPAIIR